MKGCKLYLRELDSVVVILTTVLTLSFTHDASGLTTKEIAFLNAAIANLGWGETHDMETKAILVS